MAEATFLESSRRPAVPSDRFGEYLQTGPSGIPLAPAARAPCRVAPSNQLRHLKLSLDGYCVHPSDSNKRRRQSLLALLVG